MHKISKGLILLSGIVLLLSCSDYNRVLKSPNPELKYAKSIEYYEDEDYAKTLPLLEELIPLYKGTEKGKKIYYYYCYTNYYLNYMIAAAFHFKRFANTYPHSEEAEDALFMSAFCNYLESPVPSLDQGPTYQALEELQTFANTYPKSPLVDSANKLVDELRAKIETKAYLNAYQYYKIRRYKAAIVALENFQQEYPISSFTEEVKLLVIKAYYYLAVNSIEEKKEERFQDGITAYFDFIDNFADGKNVNEAEEFYARLIRERELYLKEKRQSDEL
jgi:outer membrane protein assembly factor BamD